MEHLAAKLGNVYLDIIHALESRLVKIIVTNMYQMIQFVVCTLVITLKGVLFSLLLHHTAVNVSLDYTLLILLPPLCCNNLADTIKAL